MVKLAIDPGNLFTPAEAVHMAHCHDLIMAPMHVIADKRCLLIYFVSRIYLYRPASIKFMGASISPPQCGQMVL